jgi:Ca2+-binding EF-hand superfamily protein
MLQNFARICSCSILLLSGVAFVGCDDSDDVVLPNGEVVNFADLDTNGDGLISAAEYNAYFGSWDINGDGLISSSEWGLQYPFASLDTNGDGYLDAAEYAASFGLLDLNNDGFLDSGELLFE